MNLNKLKETWRCILDMARYWRERSTAQYHGDRFEEWVVRHSNIKGSEEKPYEPDWLLIDWRSDKYIKEGGYYPLNSCAPDLLLESIPSDRNKVYKAGALILVECKWRSAMDDFFLEQKVVEKYERYIETSRLKEPIHALFYVFGFGWEGDVPQAVYALPSQVLYRLDAEGRIHFHKMTTEERQQAFSQYRVNLEKKNPSIIYLRYSNQ